MLIVVMLYIIHTAMCVYGTHPYFLVLSLDPHFLLILSLPLLSLLQNMLPKSSAYLENTLQFHSSFKETAVGLRTVKCVLVLKKHDMFDVATVAEGGVRWWLRMVLGTFQMQCTFMVWCTPICLNYVYRLQSCLLLCWWVVCWCSPLGNNVNNEKKAARQYS